MPAPDFVLVLPEEPLRVSTAVVRLKEGAHEITLYMEGRSVTIIAESAVIIGQPIKTDTRVIPAAGR